MHGADRYLEEPMRDPASGGAAAGDQAGYPSVSPTAQGTYSVWGLLNQAYKTLDTYHACKKQ